MKETYPDICRDIKTQPSPHRCCQAFLRFRPERNTVVPLRAIERTAVITEAQGALLVFGLVIP